MGQRGPAHIQGCSCIFFLLCDEAQGGLLGTHQLFSVFRTWENAPNWFSIPLLTRGEINLLPLCNSFTKPSIPQVSLTAR